MNQGTVKFFNNLKKFGFIKPDAQGDDVFFHISGVTDGVELQEGQKVTYEITTNARTNKPEAVNVTAI